MELIPTRINGRPVVAAMRVPAGHGEIQDQAVVIVDNGNGIPTDEYRFVVWFAYYVVDVWHAEEGHYDLTMPRAIEEFDRRVKRAMARGSRV